MSTMTAAELQAENEALKAQLSTMEKAMAKQLRELQALATKIAKY